MKKPTFLGIGAQKCASTWIYDILADHPDVVLSDLKEIDYFSYKYDYGLEWYENNFKEIVNASAVGEISPSYFHELGVPERIYRHYPDVKLIVSLRDPVKRAISNHIHEIRIGHLNGDDFSLERGLKNNPAYVEQGLYAKHIERWLSVFPKEQLLILLFDDIICDKLATSQKIYRFLGIDENHVSSAINTRSNQGYINRFKKLESLRKGLRGLVDTLGMQFAWDFLARLGLRRIYSKVNKISGDKLVPEPDSKTLEALKAEFNDDLTKLEAILSKDLSMWR